MNSPSAIIESWRSGELAIEQIVENEQLLAIAEAAAIEGEIELADSLCQSLSGAQSSFVKYRAAQVTNDLHAAQEALSTCVEHSRDAEDRDHILEARARMEWGLLRFTQGESEEAGIDLKWSMERLGAISEGSSNHGLALLNMAAWHESRAEDMMALALYSKVSRHGPHTIQTISVSRLRASHILFRLGDLQAAQRNSWIAFSGFNNCEMGDMAIQAGLLWLDISLSNVTPDCELMEEVVQSAQPRTIGENVPPSAHPVDVEQVLDSLIENWDGIGSGGLRPDLTLMIEAEQALGKNELQTLLSSNQDVADPIVLDLLKSQV